MRRCLISKSLATVITLVSAAQLMLAVGCHPSPSRTVLPEASRQRVEVVGLSRNDGRLLLPVTIPTGTWWMVLDTSRRGLVLSVRAAGQPNWHPNSGPIYVHTESAMIGTADFQDLDAECEPGISRYDEQVNGYIGLPIFADVLLTIDMPRGRVVMERGSLPPADGQEVFELKADGLGRPAVNVQVNGRETLAILNTGTIDNLQMGVHPAADVAGLDRRVREDSTYFMGEPFDGEVARVDGDITIGRHRIPRPLLRVIDSGLEANCGLVLGGGLLRHFVITIDQKNRLVRLQLPDPTTVATRRVVDLGFRAERRTGEVTEVRSDSPAAAAGLRFDDRILEMNGYRWASIAQAQLSDDTLIPPSLEVPLLLQGGEGTQRRIIIHAVNPLP